MGDEPRGTDVPIVDHDASEVDGGPKKVDPKPHITGKPDETPRPKGK